MWARSALSKYNPGVLITYKHCEDIIHFEMFLKCYCNVAVMFCNVIVMFCNADERISQNKQIVYNTQYKYNDFKASSMASDDLLLQMLKSGNAVMLKRQRRKRLIMES